MQNDLYQYIKQNLIWVLSTKDAFGVSRNFRYHGVNYAQKPPHISLYQIPVDSGYTPEQLATILRSILNDPNMIVLNTFKFDHLEVETGHAQIINNSTHPYWGMGCDGNGPNELGNILQEVRQMLR